MEHPRRALVVTFRGLDLYRVRLPLRHPWRAAGHEFHEIETLLLRLETKSSRPIWVESTPFGAPVFTSEWAAASFQLLRDHFAPLVSNQSFATADDLQERLAAFSGNNYAKALLDFGYWALRSLDEQKPLHALLGSSRNEVEVGYTLGTYNSIDELLAAVSAAVNAGYRAVKLKFTRGWELEPLQAVRAQFPKLSLAIDCNASYTPQDFALFKEVDKLGLTLIEQPLDAEDDLGHAELAQLITTPICLDESASSLEHIKRAVKLKACRLVHIKPARVGGFTPALKIHNFCLENKIGCVIGSNLESGIGSELTAAFATLPAFKIAGTIFPSDQQNEKDLTTVPFLINKHAAGFPAASALNQAGVLREPHPELLKLWTLDHARL